jgi:integrase
LHLCPYPDLPRRAAAATARVDLLRSAGIWGRLRELAGVEGVAMRDMRHFFALACLSRGIPLSTVSAWMGHSDIDLTVKRYGRFAAEAREQWTWAALRAEPVEQVASRGSALRIAK